MFVLVLPEKGMFAIVYEVFITFWYTPLKSSDRNTKINYELNKYFGVKLKLVNT